MKSTLKRELKGLEIVEGEEMVAGVHFGFMLDNASLSTHCAGQRGLDGRYNHVLPPVRPRSEVTLETLSEGNHFTVLKHGPRSLTCMRVGGWKTVGASNLTGGIFAPSTNLDLL